MLKNSANKCKQHEYIEVAQFELEHGIKYSRFSFFLHFFQFSWGFFFFFMGYVCVRYRTVRNVHLSSFLNAAKAVEVQ